MFCKKCGKPINDGKNICDECIAKTNAQTQTFYTNAEETSSFNTQTNQTQNNGADYTTPNYNNYNQNPQNNINYNGQYNSNNQQNYNQYNNGNYSQGYNNSNNFNNNSQYTNQQFNPNAKSKMAAGLLGIFLGGLGVHNFYLGYTGKAVAQLLISLLSCGFLSWASAIWGLVEGILLLTGSINVDGEGNPLRD